ncbi:MAG TPA: hypothetical protein VHA52_02125, partial [Candidatus Babeliaceae bacterium]|nr:hypothetical protein [Candidatus Babeliaceae bacterium]
MKRLSIMVLCCALLVIGFDLDLQARAYRENSQEVSLAQEIKRQREELRKVILSVPAARELVESIEAVQRRIKELEDQVGISELQRKIAQLRLESCQLQQSPEVQDKLNDIRQIADRIKERTR